MTGLNLIQEYLSDTDEEIDNLKDEKLMREKLPLPESILLLKEISYHEEVLDDPSKHNGRTRSFKHERGNWATLVYIDYIPSDEMMLWMKDVIVLIADNVNLFDEFHISLTRTLVLKYHWINSFVEAVKSIAVSYQNFTSELHSIKIYCNDDKTRTFMGITIQSICNSLQNITDSLDKMITEFELPIFYQDASYHVSFLWCLGDQRKRLESLVPLLTTKFNDFCIDHPEQRYVQVENLKCKIGNKLYSFNLQ